MNSTLFRSRGARTAASAALLLAAVVLAYWPALNGGFVWDDDTLLTESALVKAADGLHRIWLTTEPLDYWPLTNTSFWLEWRLWGMQPAGYHATNLLLHTGSAFLLWAILRRLSIPGAFLAALLFAVHPVNVESVAWIAQRKNTLSMIFFLLSILWYLVSDTEKGSEVPQRARTAGRGRAGPATARAASHTRARVSTGSTRRGMQHWYWLSLAAFVLAMLSKGSVAILPGVLLMLVWWRRGVVTRADAMRTVPFFVVAIALTLVNIWFQTHLATAPIRDTTLLHRTLGAGGIFWFYLYKAILPINLLFVYPQWEIHATDIRWWLPLAAALIVSAVLVHFRRHAAARAILFAWVFFGVALVPVMGFTDVYYMTYSMVADHYQYIAIIGVVALAAAALSRTSGVPGDPKPSDRTAPPRSTPNAGGGDGIRGRAGTLLSAALVLVLGGATWRHSHQYADGEGLYRHTLRGNPSSWLVHNLLGLTLVDRSMEEAIAHFREAVRLQPNAVEPHNNLCRASGQVGRFDEAVTECSAALRLNPSLPTVHNELGEALASLGRRDDARPEFEAALRLDPANADAHNNLANILATSGHVREAIEHYREAVRLAPGFGAARVNLAAGLERVGAKDDAIEQYREALRVDPTLEMARARLGGLLQSSGSADAIAHYREALRLHPEKPSLHLDLATALLDGGRAEEALSEYRAAVNAMPESFAAHHGLGTALEELGRPSEAEAQFREAIRLKPDLADAHRSLGDVLAASRKLEDAKSEYAEALKYDPGSAEAHNNLGVVLVRLNRTDEAIAHFRAALSIQGDYADARNNLEKVMSRSRPR